MCSDGSHRDGPGGLSGIPGSPPRGRWPNLIRITPVDRTLPVRVRSIGGPVLCAPVDQRAARPRPGCRSIDPPERIEQMMTRWLPVVSCLGVLCCLAIGCKQTTDTANPAPPPVTRTPAPADQTPAPAGNAPTPPGTTPTSTPPPSTAAPSAPPPTTGSAEAPHVPALRTVDEHAQQAPLQGKPTVLPATDDRGDQLRRGTPPPPPGAR